MAQCLPSITFISDDDVLEHIVDVSGGGTVKARARKDNVAEKYSFAKADEGDSSDDTEATQTSTRHHHFNEQFPVCTVQGADLFKLGAQRRRKSSLYQSGKLKPTVGKRKRLQTGDDDEDDDGLDSQGESGQSTSDSDSDDESRHSACSDSTDSAAQTTSKQQMNSRKKSKPGSKPVQLSGHEEYFHLHGDNSVATSDATLAHLKQPMLDLQAVRALLQDAPDGHKSHRSQLHSRYTSRFSHWSLLLQQGSNLLLYGLGSKRQLLEEFRNEYLQENLHIVINGYFPGLQFKDVLTQLTEYLGCSSTFRVPGDQCQYICKRFSEGTEQLYILVHCIDGVSLRSDKIQGYLSELAQCRNIHIIASSDHINVPTMWDGSRLVQFNWLWQEVHTFCNYIEETSYENSIMVRQTGKLVYTALVHVMESLTRNGRGIFKLLAEAELQRESSSTAPGMAFQDLFSHCKESFLVSSDQALRAQLTEFLDHKLVKSKKGQDGVEYLSLAVERNVVEQYLSTLDDS
ncbi:origin recognition complex subunit 2-like [Sycon ciliatum]|uniref:origin recognition complex subunit 2-like n=1 Tax=Sycon ciliatum TaxID=27933 RepID=UPI0031F5F30E